jgi:hypothetical protein
MTVMNKLPEAVEVKVAELFGTIHHAMDDLKIEGAEANLNGDFSKVTQKNDACISLQELEAEIKAVLSDFVTKLKSSQLTRTLRNSAKRTRRPNAHLRVTVSGQTIEEPTIASTFVEVLRAIGFERVV